MEFYRRIGTDGAQVTARLGGEAMTSRFIRRFASDGSYNALTEQLRGGEITGETAALADAVSAQYAQVTAGIAELEDAGKAAAGR